MTLNQLINQLVSLRSNKKLDGDQEILIECEGYEYEIDYPFASGSTVVVPTGICVNPLNGDDDYTDKDYQYPEVAEDDFHSRFDNDPSPYDDGNWSYE